MMNFIKNLFGNSNTNNLSEIKTKIILLFFVEVETEVVKQKQY